MVRNDEPRAKSPRLFGDLRRVVDGHEHAKDVRRRIADEKTDVVPALGVTEGREGFEDRED